MGLSFPLRVPRQAALSGESSESGTCLRLQGSEGWCQYCWLGCGCWAEAPEAGHTLSGSSCLCCGLLSWDTDSSRGRTWPHLEQVASRGSRSAPQGQARFVSGFCLENTPVGCPSCPFLSQSFPAWLQPPFFSTSKPSGAMSMYEQVCAHMSRCVHKHVTMSLCVSECVFMGVGL